MRSPQQRPPSVGYEGCGPGLMCSRGGGLAPRPTYGCGASPPSGLVAGTAPLTWVESRGDGFPALPLAETPRLAGWLVEVLPMQ